MQSPLASACPTLIVLHYLYLLRSPSSTHSQVFKATNGFEFSVPEGGSFWVELAKLTGTRNYSQCRKRWGRALALDVRKVGRWNPGEDWRLLNKYLLLLLLLFLI